MKKSKSDLQRLVELHEAEQQKKRTEDEQQRVYVLGRLGLHPITASFSADDVTSNAGLLPIMDMADRIGFFDKMLSWIPETRRSDRIVHAKETLAKQCVFGHLAGAHNLIDHNYVRHDAVFYRNLNTPKTTAVHGAKLNLPGKDGIHRFLHTPDRLDDPKAFLDEISRNLTKELIRLLVESWGEEIPEEIVVDLDPTNVTLYGDQEGKKYIPHFKGNVYHLLLGFVNGMPLAFRYVIADEGAAKYGKDMWVEIVNELRRRVGKEVKIVLRGDCAFCQEEILAWVKKRKRRGHKLDCFIGQPINGVVDQIAQREHQKLTEPDRLGDMQKECLKSKKPVRDFVSIQYTPGETKEEERVERDLAVKLEYRYAYSTRNGEHVVYFPRGVVHTLGRKVCPEKVYNSYCQRGEMELWIKEGKNGTDYKHASLSKFQANVFAGFFKVAAHGLAEIFRKSVLKGTAMEKFTVESIRTHLIKIGAKVSNSRRRFHLDMSNSYVHKEAFEKIYCNLQEFVARMGGRRRAPT